MWLNFTLPTPVRSGNQSRSDSASSEPVALNNYSDEQALDYSEYVNTSLASYLLTSASQNATGTTTSDQYHSFDGDSNSMNNTNMFNSPTNDLPQSYEIASIIQPTSSSSSSISSTAKNSILGDHSSSFNEDLTEDPDSDSVLYTPAPKKRVRAKPTPAAVVAYEAESHDEQVEQLKPPKKAAGKRCHANNELGDNKDPKFCLSDQMSYADIIAYAMVQSSEKALKLNNSIRHNLSMKSYTRFHKTKDFDDTEKGFDWSLNPAEPYHQESINNAWDSTEKLELFSGVLYYKIPKAGMNGGSVLFSEDNKKYYDNLFFLDENSGLVPFEPSQVANDYGANGLTPKHAGYTKGFLPVPPVPYRNIIVLTQEQTLASMNSIDGGNPKEFQRQLQQQDIEKTQQLRLKQKLEKQQQREQEKLQLLQKQDQEEISEQGDQFQNQNLQQSLQLQNQNPQSSQPFQDLSQRGNHKYYRQQKQTFKKIIKQDPKQLRKQFPKQLQKKALKQPLPQKLPSQELQLPQTRQQSPPQLQQKKNREFSTKRSHSVEPPNEKFERGNKGIIFTEYTRDVRTSKSVQTCEKLFSQESQANIAGGWSATNEDSDGDSIVSAVVHMNNGTYESETFDKNKISDQSASSSDVCDRSVNHFFIQTDFYANGYPKDGDWMKFYHGVPFRQPSYSASHQQSQNTQYQSNAYNNTSPSKGDTYNNSFNLFNECDGDSYSQPSLLFDSPDLNYDKFTGAQSHLNISPSDLELLIADPNVVAATFDEGILYFVAVEGYKSSALFVAIKASVESPAAKADAIKKVNGVFHLVIKNTAGTETTWTIDFKNKGDVILGAEGTPDITISMSDDTFVDLADGKINGQKAFMSGKLKVKGNVGLATKLDSVLKAAKTAPIAAISVTVTTPSSDGETVNVAGFESGALFAEIEAGLKTSPKAQLEAAVKKVKAVFQFDVKNSAGTVQIWTLDLKNGTGSIVKGTGAKADVTVAVGDKDFVDLANGKLNGQKAFMSGKIKVKGQIMLATKLDSVLKDMRPKAKL
ncbi:hypothetical protein HK100_010517 [Physocladia obscura]|uniref:Fork-head domain-containing protein n=1 Tax=Physocladia obscura TaxID=109957 RepID=A0AAD5XDS7_9FUNG|nr:hypothetical protein HK100_010517 [Physocladia obscura]